MVDLEKVRYPSMTCSGGLYAAQGGYIDVQEGYNAVQRGFMDRNTNTVVALAQAGY